MKENPIKKGYTQVFIAGLFWGTAGLFIQLLSGFGASNALISILRVGSGTLVIAAVAWFTCGGIKAFIIDKKSLFLSALMGLTTQSLFSIVYIEAVASVGVATAAVLLYSSIIFVCIFSRILFKEPITSLKIVALTINIAGCILTVTGGNLNALSFIMYGTIMGTLAALGYSTAPIFGKIITKNAHPYVISFYSFLFGTLFLIPFLYGKPLIYGPLKIEFIALGFAAGSISAAIPSMLYLSGLSKPVEASKVNVIASVEIVIASVLGVCLFSEFFNGWKFSGMLLVLISIIVLNLSPSSVGKIEQNNE